MPNDKIKYGIVYVVVHPARRAVKVGYTSPGAGRIEELMRDGWQPFRRLHVATPDIARTVEQATLFDLRNRLYIPQFLTSDRMRTFGWTETASIGLIDPKRLWEIVCEQAGLLQMSPSVSAPDRRRTNGGVPPRRRPGDTPQYVPAAGREASRTARAAKVGRTLPKRAASDTARRNTPREDS